MSFWLIPACLLLLIALPVLLLLKKKNNKQMNLPRGPPGLPIIGNLHQIGDLPHLSFQNFSNKYGPLFYLKLGSVPTVVASSPDTVRQLLKSNDINCCTRPILTGGGRLSYNYSDLVFSPYNEYWRELRKICTHELFSNQKVESFKHIRQEEVALFVDSVNESALTQTPFNFGEKFMYLSGNVVSRTGFGMRLQESKIAGDGYKKLIADAMWVTGAFAAADFLPYAGWAVDRLTGFHAKCEKVFRTLDEFYDDVIENHMKRQQDGEDIVDMLLRIERDQAGVKNGFRLTRNHIKGILMLIIYLARYTGKVAGLDTTALTLEWIMTLLIVNPRVMKKVQTEIRDRIKDKENIAEEDIEILPYLSMVIKESFRLNPASVLLAPRETVTDIQINGYHIPAKTRIEINVWAITHDPTVWKDPNEFIPERFLNSDIDYKGQDFELLPFGSGRRSCPGMNSGIALIHATLINLLYRFDWKLPEDVTEKDVSFEGKPGIVVGKKIPLELVPVRTQWT